MEETQKENIPDILKLESKEKFRRKLLLITRLCALLLILAIFYIGYIQIVYVKEINSIKGQYGTLGWCYLCGQEALRKCDCQYRYSLDAQMPNWSLKEIGEETALYNVMPCEIKEDNDLDYKSLNLTVNK